MAAVHHSTSLWGQQRSPVWSRCPCQAGLGSCWGWVWPRPRPAEVPVSPAPGPRTPVPHGLHGKKQLALSVTGAALSLWI